MVKYKNWKSEIAWLRGMATHCTKLSELFRGNAKQDFLNVAKILSDRADSLEKAKGTAQPS